MQGQGRQRAARADGRELRHTATHKPSQSWTAEQDSMIVEAVKSQGAGEGGRIGGE